ncbi:site-specific integrase [Chryseobacterium piscium]|uniref:Site-specific integrase n=2 Tax=Chryseobacterium piscium TaxID=333702 RepID=A0A3D9BT81_9FLAO|nr:site-specific integrase [Chryseobacterium piscium]
MNTMKLSILFLLRRNRTNEKGVCAIECRITLDKQRKPFSTGIFINPEYWNASKQKAHPPNKGNNQINTQLSLIKQEINQAFLYLQVQEKEFSVEDIYSQFKGENVKLDKSIKEMFHLHISKQEKLIGISTTKVSVAKFYQTQAHILSFIKKKYNRSDYLLKDMSMAFITEFEFYLKTEKRFMQNTIYKTLQRFRQIVKLSVALDYLPKDPFLLYKGKKPKKEIIFLSKDELRNLEQHQFASERLQQVADMFIFCCYTGLAYTEMATLKESNIQVGFDDNKWLYIKRQKTKKSYEVPLLSKASDILDKYRTEEQLLPVVSNQRFNSYLKEIAEIAGIDKILTHHIARKTFASTILLYNNVPMEIVSELLGHSEIGITQQHYAKIVKEKISEEMQNLNSKLSLN